MFNIANVIYRTKFVDGVSTVAWTIVIGSSRTRALGDAENTEDSAATASSKTASNSRGNRRNGKENAVA
jgi:hypothetical protein